MRLAKPRFIRPCQDLLLFVALLLVSTQKGNASWDYGDGRHGSFVLTTNATIEALYLSVRLTNDPPQYDPSNSNAIPNFQNLLITNGATLTANPWNGSSGGWIVLKVEATLSIGSGSLIEASGIGYRGGGWLQQGESYPGGGLAYGQPGSTARNGGGGGGGFQMPNGYWTSAGGGGYGTGGGSGGGNPFETYNGFDYRGIGGDTYGDQSLTTIYLGSGGGGGSVFAPAPKAYPFTGGGGGGAIVLNAGSLEVSGQIQANGTPPHYEVSGTPTVASSGGGGSGGSIVLRAKTATLGVNQIAANGGSGSGNGGSGGVGRILVAYAQGYSGGTTPQATTIQDADNDNVTVITSQPTAQTNLLGANIVFNVGVYGLPPLLFQWNFNDIPIPGATNQSLSLTNISLTNTGNYSVTISNAVMTLVSSNAFLMVLDTATPLGDGIPNWWKSRYGLSLTDPTLATNFPAGDRLTYVQKYLYGFNPLTTNTDGSGISDYDEIFVYHGNPLNAAPVSDGIPATVKVQYGLNPLVNNANTEAGFDGVTYLQIYQYNLAHTNRLDQLDPHNPFALPGTSNYELITSGQHTNRYAYDRNDRLVGAEYSRGISIAYRYDGNGNLVGQTVLSRNSETNGLPVLWRYLNELTNNTSPYVDSDGDGWTDYQEWQAGTDPNNPNSRPNLLGNTGTNIASLSLPFTPSNFVVGVGQLGGAGEDIVIGADGNPGTNHNFLLVLTQTSTGWPTQRVEVGAFGITSIAVGQVTNRPGPAIYAGLRQPGGTGRIIELMNAGSGWQTNTVATSTNEAAYVLGVRGANLLASLATTNAPDGALYVAAYSTSWDLGLLDALPSHKGLGTVALWPTNSPAPLRILDQGGLELGPLEEPLGPTNLALAGIATQSSDYAGGDYPARLAIDGNTNNFTGTADGDPHPTWTLDLRSVCILDHLEIYNRNNCCPERLTNYTVAVFGSGGTNSVPVFNQTYSLGPIPPGYQTIPLNGLTGEFIQVQLQPPLYDSSYLSLAEVRAMGWPSSIVSIDSPPAQAPLFWRGQSVASGILRPSTTNSFSVVCGFADDRNANGLLDVDDNFVIAEYLVNGTNASQLTLFQQRIASAAVAQSYGLASVNYLNSSNQVLFTGEPDGQVFVWTAVDATNALQRQLFSAQYAGKAWHALAGVQTLGPGEGLAGLVVDPASQNTCSVVFWPPQKALAPPPNIVETAPFAVVIPSPIPLGGMAVVTIRLWDAEGNASTPFLQYQILGETNWLNAAPTLLDGGPYSPATRVDALPTGTDHALVWNVVADLGVSVVTNVLLRARAEDFMLVGDWSLPTPFQVNTVQISNTNGLPDWWQILYFGHTGVDPNLDSDGDGLTNLQEYLAGTNPTDPDSVLRITAIQMEAGEVHIRWKAGATIPQYLQRNVSLADPNGWQDIFTNSTPMTGVFVDGPLADSPRFYRIRLGP